MVDKSQLVSIFRELGARDPEDWADSEISEDIPQLARFLFLKGCWDVIAPDGDTSWIDNVLENVPESSDEPFAGQAHAIRRMLAKGCTRADIAELVRCVQAELLFDICYLMEDPDSVKGNREYVNWAFVELDEEDAPTRTIAGLYESVLETDPSGREMRPKPP